MRKILLTMTFGFLLEGVVFATGQCEKGSREPGCEGCTLIDKSGRTLYKAGGVPCTVSDNKSECSPDKESKAVDR